MSKQKILFIIQSYPSERSANVLCDEKLILQLLAIKKYEIHVLAYQYNKQPKEELINGIRVHRFTRGPLWDMYTWARHQKNSWKTWFIFTITRLLLRVQQFIMLPFYPLTELWAIWLYSRQAQKLHNREMFNLIVAEHNGLDTLMTGYLLKKKFPQVKFMPIFWDALSGGFSPKYLPRCFSLARRKQLELKIFQTADQAIAMQSHEQHIRSCFDSSLIAKKLTFLNVPYFVKFKLIGHTPDIMSSNQCNIVFAGNLWGRNPESFFRALHECKIKNLKVWIISGSKRKAYIESLAYKYHIDTQYLDFVPHEQLGQLLARSSILLNFGVTNPQAISGKIFEYMGFGKPIISTYSIDNEACLPYLQKYPLSFLLDERKTSSPEQIASLRSFIEQNADKKIAYEEIAPLFYKNTPQAYVEEINKLLELE